MMDEAGEVQRKSVGAGVLRALRPAVPAVIGAAALTFLFAAVMPMAWVAGISWNLYLDRLSGLFVPPVGNGARLALAFAMTLIAALIAGFVALLIARPEETGLAALGRRVRRRAEADTGDDYVPPRRRADRHPDDPPRAPIRAGRDLPAAGLAPAGDTGGATAVRPMPEDGGLSAADELVLADLAPTGVDIAGDEPWLQPAEMTAPPMPDSADKSLGAMVARFEAGLARRRGAAVPAPAMPAAAMSDVAANEDGEPEVDFALEAALSTLQRMNREANG